MTLEEKSILLADFMGYERTDKDYWEPTFKGETKGEVLWPRDFKYNTSYDALMPVWVKFRDLKLKKDNLKDGQALHRTLIRNAITDLPIEKAFEKLTEALIWYNSIKK